MQTNAPTARVNAIETLSSNTLFHFTGKREYLEGIIEHGIVPRYSLEDLSMFKWHTDGTGIPPKIAIPMACFCDIPLSKVKHHLSWYGEYGIGIDKKWGMEQGICPIIYIDPLSYTTKAMTDALGAYTKIWSEGLKDDKDYPDLFNALERLMLFSKPYVGPFEHNSQKDSEKIFYDEREWRFVPDLTKTKIRQLIYSSDPEFLDARDKNINLLKNNSEFSISITPSNIKYIIVENEDDIKPVMRKIEDSFGDQKYTPNAMQKLMTKIITTKQIREDF